MRRALTGGNLVHVHNCSPDADWGFGVYLIEEGEPWVQYTIAKYRAYPGRFVLREALWTFTGPVQLSEDGE